MLPTVMMKKNDPAVDQEELQQQWKSCFAMACCRRTWWIVITNQTMKTNRWKWLATGARKKQLHNIHMLAPNWHEFPSSAAVTVGDMPAVISKVVIVFVMPHTSNAVRMRPTATSCWGIASTHSSCLAVALLLTTCCVDSFIDCPQIPIDWIFYRSWRIFDMRILTFVNFRNWLSLVFNNLPDFCKEIFWYHFLRLQNDAPNYACFSNYEILQGWNLL